MIKLTPKQEKFVLGLIEGKSQRKAYIDAGYSTKGKSGEYLDKEASTLLKIGRFSEGTKNCVKKLLSNQNGHARRLLTNMSGLKHI